MFEGIKKRHALRQLNAAERATNQAWADEGAVRDAGCSQETLDLFAKRSYEAESRELEAGDRLIKLIGSA